MTIAEMVKALLTEQKKIFSLGKTAAFTVETILFVWEILE